MYSNELRRSQAPTFDSPGEERVYRKERLAAAFRLFSRLGFSEGIAGHIAVRDPETPEHFWVNPYGMHFGHIRTSDLLLVNEQGEVIEGDRPVNVSAFAIHASIHAARPDVIASAHAHALHGKAWSSLGRLLDPLTQDACIFYEKHSLSDPYAGPVYDPEEGKRLGECLGSNKAIILRNHGFLTVGESLDEAAWLFITMERTAQAQLLAEAAGAPKNIEHDIAVLTEQHVGSHEALRFAFQPLFDRIAREEPDLFE